jgi:uroporphyrinogen decarboxylase
VVVPTPGGSETYREVAVSPLESAATVEEVDGYAHWASADWYDYTDIEAQCDAIRDRGRVAVFMGDRLNRISQLKPAMYVRGMEQIYVDMKEQPEVVRAVFSNIRRFYMDYSQRIYEAANGKLDALMMGDDFGSQNGPLISPAAWEHFLGPGFGEYVELAKSYGVRVIHHTCGAVRPLIPLMIERGLEVLQSVQPEAQGMEPRGLKAEFGCRLSFHGGLSIQQTLPFGSPEDVRNEARDRIEALAPGGGYILCTSHNVQADTSVENFRELLSAYRAYGSYS